MTELGDYARTIGRRWWLIAVVTVAAGVLAAVLFPPDDVYITSARVSIDASEVSSNERNDLINDFRTAASTRSVQDTVSEETGLSRGSIDARVSTRRVAASGFIDVVYESKSSDPETAQAVIVSVAKNSVSLVNAAEVSRLEAEQVRRQELLDEAQAELTEAEAALAVAIANNDDLRPDDEFDQLQREVAALRQQVNQATDLEEIATLQGLLEEREAGLSSTSRDALAFEALVEDAAASRAEVGEAVDELDAATRELVDASAEPQVTFQRVTIAGKEKPSLAQRVVSAAAIGFLLSTILVIVWEMWTRRSRGAHDGPSLDDAGFPQSNDIEQPASSMSG